jgi:hypothetical protein
VTWLLAPLLAIVAASPAPSPTPVPTWTPWPEVTAPPLTADEIDAAHRRERRQDAVILYGLMRPYCGPDSGGFSGVPSFSAEGYPVTVQCVRYKIRVDAPGKATRIP